MPTCVRLERVERNTADMIEDHTTSTAELKAAAARATDKPVPAGLMTPGQQTKLSALKALSGSAFDREYAQQQVAAHTKTLAALTAFRDGGNSTQLKAFARKTAPIVEHHLQMAQQLGR